MKKAILTASVSVLLSLQSFAQIDLNSIEKQGADALKKVDGAGAGTSSPLSNDDVVKGLKEALNVGTKNSTASASATDGFFKNPLIFIPFPPDAQKVKDKAIALGQKDQVDKFEQSLNRAAEEASKEAATILINAITSMSVSDGFAILKGANNAATQYLRDKTTADLLVKFKPIVDAAIAKVQVTKEWTPLITTYNRIPFVEKQNPDLSDYVTKKALDGLFKLVEAEELKIRQNPAAQVTDLLKKVFGSVMK